MAKGQEQPDDMMARMGRINAGDVYLDERWIRTVVKETIREVLLERELGARKARAANNGCAFSNVEAFLRKKKTARAG